MTSKCEKLESLGGRRLTSETSTALDRSCRRTKEHFVLWAVSRGFLTKCVDMKEKFWGSMIESKAGNSSQENFYCICTFDKINWTFQIMFPWCWCLLMPTVTLLWLQREGRIESPLQLFLNFILTVSQTVVPKSCNLQAEERKILQCVFKMTDCLSNPVVCLVCLNYKMTCKVWIIVQLSDGWVIKKLFPEHLLQRCSFFSCL